METISKLHGTQNAANRFKPRPATCSDCKEPMVQNSGRQLRCASCKSIDAKRRAYEHNIKSGKIKMPGIGRAKPMSLGKNNGNWKGGSLPWQRKMFRKDECDRCDSDDRVELHHQDRDTTNADESNLETLCFLCHRKEHAHEPGHETHREYNRGNN